MTSRTELWAVLVVSSDLEAVPAHRRPRRFYRHRDYDTPPDPEFGCLTPAEFEDQIAKHPHVVRTAVTDGVSVV